MLYFGDFLILLHHLRSDNAWNSDKRLPYLWKVHLKIYKSRHLYHDGSEIIKNILHFLRASIAHVHVGSTSHFALLLLYQLAQACLNEFNALWQAAWRSIRKHASLSQACWKHHSIDDNARQQLSFPNPRPSRSGRNHLPFWRPKSLSLTCTRCERDGDKSSGPTDRLLFYKVRRVLSSLKLWRLHRCIHQRACRRKSRLRTDAHVQVLPGL